MTDPAAKRQKPDEPAQPADEDDSMTDSQASASDEPVQLPEGDYPPDSCMEKSAVPACCATGEPVVLGIDEAGRGSVIGPMTYGMAYWRADDADELERAGFDDSKALSAESRAQLFTRIKDHGRVGWAVRVIGGDEISFNMLRGTPRSLNAISHDAAIELVTMARRDGVNVVEAFVDTVGDPARYEEKLTRHFDNAVRFTVRKKADSIYKVVSAASICAKVRRDQLIEEYQYPEPGVQATLDFNSGYPSDPKSKQWMQDHMDAVFGYPRIVRFSWAPCKDLLEEDAARVEWAHEQDVDAANNVFASFAKAAKPKRPAYFRKRKLEAVAAF